MEAKLIKARIEMGSIHMSHIPLTHNRVCAANGLICPDNRKKMKLQVMTVWSESWFQTVDVQGFHATENTALL